MAGEINFDAYSDALLVLGTAGIVVPIVRRLGVSPVLGYLAAGALLGPIGLGTFKPQFPILRWLTITDAANVAGIAELGVVFLLFLMGLELSFERLSTMRRLVFGLGGLQVLVSTAVLAGLMLLLGQKGPAAVVLGLCLALSSTAIVLEVLSHARRLSTTTGRASFAILLAQDLAVVPLFLIIAALAASGSGTALSGISTALLQAALAVIAILGAGRLLLRPLLRLVAATGSLELFIAATLFVVVSAGVAAAAAGLSMALGAFVAGLMLAETEYRKQIEAIIEPFKSLLLGVFFFTIGMRIDVRQILADPAFIAGAVVALIVIKAVIVLGLMRVFRLPRAAMLEASLMLGPAGEFAFVGIGLATAAGIVRPGDAAIVLVVSALGMALIPGLHALGAKLAGLAAAEPQHVEPPLPPEPGTGHTIVIGHGRVGRIVVEMLERHGQPYIAADSNPHTVAAERRNGRPVYVGNAAEPGFLERCGLMDAKALVLTIHNQKAIDEIVERVRKLCPDLAIVARARDAEHAQRLYSEGVTDAVPETIEASLQLSEAVLVGIGVATGPVIATIHEKRDEVRHQLQDAARSAGRDAPRALRAKRTANDH